ncbi:MAG: flippase-like domain-containing protein [Planctomycetes bacterium]|nr:flippase-like domain-containing protein [Planctomycetota bacterium]
MSSSVESMAHRAGGEPATPWWRWVVLALFAIGAYAVWLLWADAAAVGQAMGQFGAGTVALALFWASLNYLLRWCRWQVYLRRLGCSVPRGESGLVFVAGFVMTLTPAKMGEVLKSLLLKRSCGLAIATTAPIVVAERVTDLAGLVLLMALGCLRFERGVPVAIAAAGLVVVLGAVGAIPALGTTLVRWVGRLPVLSRKADRLQAAYLSLHRLSDLRTFAVATAWSTLGWGSHCVCLWQCAHGLLPGAIDGLESCLAYAAPLLGGTLILVPGGLGATESSMTGLLGVLSEGGFDPGMAAAVALLVRLVTFWWAILLGAVAFAVWRTRHADAK